MDIYCVECEEKVNARLTGGNEIYPHRKDLYNLSFWKCDKCGNYVGCHYKNGKNTNSLGNIPTKELREARKQIHKLLDPLWKSRQITRKALYNLISKKMGHKYHTAEIKSIKEAKEVYGVILNIIKVDLWY